MVNAIFRLTSLLQFTQLRFRYRDSLCLEHFCYHFQTMPSSALTSTIIVLFTWAFKNILSTCWKFSESLLLVLINVCDQSLNVLIISAEVSHALITIRIKIVPGNVNRLWNRSWCKLGRCSILIYCFIFDLPVNLAIFTEYATHIFEFLHML